jgi:hypothetical protein
MCPYAIIKAVNKLVTDLLRFLDENRVFVATQFVCGQEASDITNGRLEDADSRCLSQLCKDEAAI